MNPEPSPPIASGESAPAPFALRSADRLRVQIAADYHHDGEPLSVRTIDRCNAIGRLPSVNEPPPWDDPRAMGEWYRVHYRSDPTRPPKSTRTKLPAWLLQTIARTPAPASPAVPAAASPLQAPLESFPRPSVPATPAAPPTQVQIHLPTAPSDAISTAQDLLSRVHDRYLLVRDDPALAPAAERAYLEALEKVQQAQDRARRNGDTETLLRTMVDDRIDRVHTRLPTHLASELAALRSEIHRASADPALFLPWCQEFFSAVGRRLIRSGLQAPA